MAIVAQHFDSSLGRWTHTGWTPGPGHPLEWAVDRVWDFHGMAAAPQERVFPNGHLELIVQLDDRYLDVTASGAVPTPAACVTGIFSHSAVVQAPRRPCRVLGVRLRPAGAWALLGHPLWQLAELTADLGDLLGPVGGELAERCHGADGGIERVRRAVAWLGARLAQPDVPRVDPAVQWVARRIAESGGTRAIGALRAETGLTDARLISLFREQVGVTPKRLARIHRFDRALGLLTRGHDNLATVAQRAGYFDQPHMNAEFREMAGLTPRGFLAATRYPNSLSLPEPA
ncbi:MAG TPA: AraC family transcriptional regulator [Gemmatimonadales bacterium]|nr:AraC family transcriptional regulator [Gemmatimonadales bacterium]